MKACAACGRLYPDDAAFCPLDGSRLRDVRQVAVAPSAEDARVGCVLCGRYQLRRVVADGGLGRVYEALEFATGRHVALKVLHAEVAQDEVALERFRREFEVSKQLPHEYIVDVLDFQATDDRSYALAMEFLYGEELRATLKRERVLAPERTVRMVSQAAIALDAAHARRLVHRDLKPDNLFLCQTTEGDNLKILDFGSVKDKADTARKLTVMGTTIGSPFYMSPEQAQGLDTLDHRADVWTLAAITYECVTGQVPFCGSNGPSILLAILSSEPTPPSQAGAGQKYAVPPSLDEVIAQGLNKAAAERIGSAGAFADALGAAYGLQGSHAQWAQTPQQDLAVRIAARLPGLMQTSSALAVAGSSAAAASAGMEGATAGCSASGGAPALADARPVQPAPRRADAAAEQSVAPTVPTRSVGLSAALLLGGLVLLVVVAAVMVLAW
jgi:serine/threonine protein kinase